MAKTIELTKGAFSTVDDADYEHLRALNLRWCLNGPYAFNSSLGLLHRYLLGLPTGKLGFKRKCKQKGGRNWLQIDHVNGDKLDNRRENLRVTTPCENQQNRRAKYKGHSRFKGAHWEKTNARWMARIRVNGKLIYLGSFDTDLEAGAAYNEAAKMYFGEYASLNVLDSELMSPIHRVKQLSTKRKR